MKKILFTVVASLLIVAASAQLPNGSLAPNFEATDINGNTHNLYEYLQEGYTVVLDISATWCGPCWAYHTGAYNGTNGQGALHQLYEDHSVDNGGNVIVLMIEGDGTTNTDCLYGATNCNSSTQGDWVTDTPYPIIDDASIASAYQIAYYPTIYTICPNGIVTETSQITAADHWAFIQQNSCQTVFANDALLLNYTGTTNSCSTADLSVNVANIGSTTLSSLNITVSGVTPAIDFDWSGSLAIFESENVSLGTANVNPGEDVVITITTADDNLANNTMMPPVGATISTTHLHLELQTDAYPGDFTLHIYDENDIEVATGGPWAEYNVQLPAMFIEEDYYLSATGCYRVVLEDQYGDGLFEGYCLVYGMDAGWNDLGNVLNVPAGVPFASAEGAANVNEVVSVKENSLFSSFQAYPNPTDGLLNVRFALPAATNTRMELVDVMGNVIMNEDLGQLPAGEHTQQLDLQGYAGGVYMLNVTGNGHTSSFRVTIR